MANTPRFSRPSNIDVEDMARAIEVDLADNELLPVHEALNKHLIHPDHLSSTPCTHPPQILRMFIRTGLNHVLWEMYDQMQNIKNAESELREALRRITGPKKVVLQIADEAESEVTSDTTEIAA